MNTVIHTNTKVGLVPSMELDIVTHGSQVLLVLRLKSRGIRIRVAAIYVEWVNWVDHGGLNLVKNIINNRKRVIPCHSPLINKKLDTLAPFACNYKSAQLKRVSDKNLYLRWKQL